MFKRNGVLALCEVVCPILKAIPLNWLLIIQRLDESIEIEVADLGLFETFHVGIVLEVADAVEEGDLHG